MSRFTGEVLEAAIERFQGVQTDTNPLALPKEITNNALNVYGDGTFIAKRPGTTGTGGVTGNGGPSLGTSVGVVTDMIRAAVSSTERLGAPDWMWVLGSAGPTSNVNLKLVDFSGAVTDIGDLGFANTRFSAKMVAAGADRVYITPPGATANWTKIVHNAGQSPWVGKETYTGANGNTGAFCAVAHRHHMFWGGYTGVDLGGRLQYSDADSVESFPANNFEDLGNGNAGYEGGRSHHLGGLFKMGDALYLGKDHGVWVCTGADAASFGYQQIAADFGFHGMRTWAPLDEGTGIGLCGNTVPGFGVSSNDDLTPDNIAIISGFSGKKIGWTIRSLIQASHGMITDARVAHWEQLGGTLIVPDVHFNTTLPVSAIYRDKLSGAWWPWMFSAFSPTAFTEGFAGRMYVACVTGSVTRTAQLQWFDELETRDLGNAAPFAANWATAPLSLSAWVPGSSHETYHIEWVRVWGVADNTTPAPISVQIATDGSGVYGPALPMALNMTGVKGSPQSQAGYTTSLRINFDPAARRAKVYRILVGLKVIGHR